MGKLHQEQKKITEKLNDLKEELSEIRASIESIDSTSPEPPFWGWFKIIGVENEYLVRVIMESGDQFYHDQANSQKPSCDDSVSWHQSYFQRLATEAEVKKHQIKLAKERGFVEGTHYSWPNDALCNIEFRIEDQKWTYRLEDDTLYNNHWAVCRKGEWATIIEDRLPTFEELGVASINIKMRYPVLEEAAQIRKPITLIKLMRVANHVNSDWNGQASYFVINCKNRTLGTTMLNANYATSPVKFRDNKAANMAIKIFRSNGEEDALIEFYQ